MSDLKDSEPWKAEMLKEAKALLDALVAKQRALEGTDSTQSSNGLAKQGSLRLINDLVLEGEQAASCRSLLQENAVTRTENKDSPHERERNSDGDEGKVRIDADLEIIDLADLEQRSNEKFAEDVGKSNEEETKRAIISEADKCSQSFAVNPVLGQAYTEAYQRFGRTASSSFSLRFKQISFTGFSRSNSLRMFCLKLFGSKYWITFHFFLAILHGLCASAIAFMSADHAGSHTLDGRTYDLQSSWMASGYHPVVFQAVASDELIRAAQMDGTDPRCWIGSNGCVQVFIETFACTSVSSDNWSPACQSPLITRYDFSTKPWNVSITGGYQFFKMCNILRNSTPGQYDGLYPLDHKGRYHTCQMNLFQEEGQDSVTEMCETVGNVEELGYFGLMHFDHFFGAVLAISQWIFPDNAYDVLWFSYQSQYQVWFITFLFYPFILILCHWMDLGFFVGIVTETFRRIQPSIVTADEIHNHAADLSDHPVRKNTSISPEHMFAPTLEKIEMNQDEQLLLELAKTLRTNAIYQHFQSLVVISHIITLGLYTYQASATNSNIFFAIIVNFPTMQTLSTASGSAFDDAQKSWIIFESCRTLDEISRSNFSSVGYAFLTIFQLTAGDSWSRILYSAIHVKETFAGQILLINLLVAIIIQNFTYDVTFKRENEEASQAIQSLRGMFAKTFLKLRKARSNFPVLPSSKNRSRVRPEETNQQDVEVESNPQEQENASVVPLSEPMPATEGSQNQIPLEGGESVRSNASKVSPFDLATHRGLSSKIVLYHSNSRTEEERSDEDDNAKSCVFLFTLAPYDDIPNYPYLINSSITNIANLIFNIIFSVESIIRIMNVGFIFSEGAYLRSPWNLLDFVVICISWLQGLVQFQSLSNAKILRLVRALRPLRVMKQNRGMRNTINALVLSLVPLSYIFFFLAFIIVAFGIVAMGIFGGKFFSCSDPNVSYPEGKAQCSGTFVNTDNRILYASSWTNQRHNFDDFWTSALTLFKVTTIKYVSVMQNAMDVTSVDVSPLQDAHAENAVFFVTYIAIGSFFIWNLMIGFIVDAFTVNKGITSAEKDLYNFILRVQLHKPKITAHKFPKASMKLRRLIESGPFRMLSLFFIAVNIGFMLSDHSDASDLLIKIIYWQNVSTYILLGIEVILNFLAYGLKGFFVDRWRIFDLVIVLTSFTLLAGPTGSYLQFLKGLRLIRIFRLLNQIRPVRVILETFLLCLPQFINVISMLFLIYVIFAAVAVQLFGITRSGVRIGPTANFDTLGSSFVTCLQILTGDEWQEMLEDLSVQPPFCSYQFSSLYISGYTGKNYSFGDCGFYKTGTTIFFICFKLICEGMLINLFVGMILDNFSFVILEATTNVEAEMDESQGVNQVQLYAHVFRKYDKGTGRLPVNCLEPFMRDLPPPMGFASLSARRHTNERMNRTYLKFIRAELHLIMRERNSSDSKAGSNNFFSYIASQSSGALNPEASILNQFDFNFAWKKSDEFRNAGKNLSRSLGVPLLVPAVSWEDLMFTLALWRMPSIIPQRLRDARKARIAEIQEIKHALVIRDFLRRKTIRGKSFKDLRLEKERREMEGEVEKREDEAENDEAKFNDEDDGQVPGDPVEEKKGDGKEEEDREGEETREEVKHDQWKRGERTDQEEEKEMEMNDAEEDMKAFS
eukprot:756535-Hanusia_phi.AAC.3